MDVIVSLIRVLHAIHYVNTCRSVLEIFRDCCLWCKVYIFMPNSTSVRTAGSGDGSVDSVRTMVFELVVRHFLSPNIYALIYLDLHFETSRLF